jgi:glycosyltransferase involved in cell wall biosynthesis
MTENFQVKKITIEKDLPDISIFNKMLNNNKTNKIAQNKKIVVYLGGLQLYKGIKYLMDAIPLINEDYLFLIMGYPNEEVKKIAKKMNVSERITFTGKYYMKKHHLI